MSGLGYTTKAFNSAARSETGFGFGLEQQQTAAVTQKKTFLQSTGSKVNTHISSNNLSGASNVKADGKGASSKVDAGRKMAASAKQEARGVKAAISSEIRKAQGEIASQLKEMGHAYKDVFPDERMAAGGEAQFLGAAAVMSFMTGAAFAGKGTFSSLGKKASSAMDNLFAGLKGGSKNTKNIIAELQERLIEQSPTQQDTRQDNTGPLFDSASSQNEKPTQFDWKSFFEDGGDLEKIAHADPDNPAPGICPEWDRANEAEGSARYAEAKLDGAAEKIKAGGFQKGGDSEKDVYANAEAAPLKDIFNADKVTQTSGDSLPYLSGIKIAAIDDIAALKDVKDSVPVFNLEPPPQVRRAVDFSKPPLGTAA